MAQIEHKQEILEIEKKQLKIKKNKEFRSVLDKQTSEINRSRIEGKLAIQEEYYKV